MRVRKKPVEIDGIQWDGTNIHEIWDAFGAQCVYGPTEENLGTLIITTLEGDMSAPVGWWILRGVEGELYPCKPSVFDTTYEVLDAEGG